MVYPVVVSNKTPWKHIEINNCGIFVRKREGKFCYQAFSDIAHKDFDSK